MNYLFIGPDATDYKIMYKDFANQGEKYYSCYIPLDVSIEQGYVLLNMSIKEIILDNKIIIIISGRVYERLGNHLLTYLRNKFVYSRICLYLVDVIPSYLFDIYRERRHFDEIFTYDKADAQKYNLQFCQEPFSYYECTNSKEQCDLIYVGSAKNRIDKVIEVYDSATNAGLKCLFYIFGVDNENIIYRDGIAYNQFLSFDKVLEITCCSKMILEVLENDMFSPTTRFAEAILYDKVLISNSPQFTYENPYNNVVYYSDANEINWYELRKIKVSASKEQKELFCIDNMIKTIEAGISW